MMQSQAMKSERDTYKLLANSTLRAERTADLLGGFSDITTLLELRADRTGVLELVGNLLDGLLHGLAQRLVGADGGRGGEAAASDAGGGSELAGEHDDGREK
jgi:hypothetical protein